MPVVEDVGSVRVLRGRDELDRSWAGLEGLLAAVTAPVTSRRLWLDAWLDCNRDFEPLVVAVEGSGGYQAAAVLACRRRAAWTDVVAAGDGPSDRILLPATSGQAAERLAEGLAEMLDGLRRPWTLSLTQLPVADPVAVSLGRRLPTCRLGPHVSAPTLRFGGERGLDAYTSRSYRQNSRTMRNRLDREQRSAVIQSTREPGAVAALARETEPLRLARDRAEGRPSMLARRRHREFRRTVLERLACQDEAEITTLRVDGRLAAYAVVLLDGRARRLWDTAFAPEWGRFGAGHLVVEAVLEGALADAGCEELDFMRGLEPYKLRLANAVVESSRLQAWSSRRTRAVVHLRAGWRSLAYYRWLGSWLAGRRPRRVGSSQPPGRSGAGSAT